jgi:hypothetical protein
MSAEHRQQIVARWKAAFGQYEELRASAEPAVVRWEWTSGGERYSPLPLFFKRFPGRARALKEPPAVKAQHIEYGLDDQDRPRVRRIYNYLEQAFEAFYRYGEELTEIIEFSPPRRIPLHVEQVFYDRGRVTRYASFRLNGYTPLYSQKGQDPAALYDWLGPNGRFVGLENYDYEGDRLTTISAYREAPTGASDPSFRYEEHFSYDDTGKLQRIERVFSYGVTEVVYQKRAPGETFTSIRAAVTQKMIEAIVERLRAAHIAERLCCIELAYRAVEHYFPPYLVLGPENHRQRLLDSGDPDARYYIFTPVMDARPDNGLWLEITDPETLEACQQLDQEIQTGEKWTTATRILRDVAAALTHYDWTGIFDTTPDFVVFAIDHEMDDLEAALRASASTEQIRAWKKKGWLP